MATDQERKEEAAKLPCRECKRSLEEVEEAGWVGFIGYYEDSPEGESDINPNWICEECIYKQEETLGGGTTSSPNDEGRPI